MFGLSRCLPLLCAAGIVWAAGRPATGAASLSEGGAALARLPLRFEANRGQARPEVSFTARAQGYNLSLTAAGPVVHAPGSKPVSISLVNANRASRLEGVTRLPARTDYFVGAREKWRTSVPTYERVRHHEAYPGIDVVYYGNRNQLEYDFVLRPGADPRAIRLKFHGPARVRLSDAGDLVLESAGASIVQKRPFVYQEDRATGELREIAGGYELLGRNTVGLRVEKYRRDQTLVIDPVLTYGTYLGGTGTDQILGARLGPHGRLYLTGSTTTQAIEASSGAYDSDLTGFTDAFLAIIDATPGSGFPLVYYSYLGGSGINVARAIDVDPVGVAYITGDTTSTDFPLAGNALQSTGAATTTDGFITRIDPSREGEDSLLYSSFLGGTDGEDSGHGIAVDPNGVAYIIGTTKSTDFPLTDSGAFRVAWGPSEAFVTVLDTNSGDLLYSTYLGGESFEDGRAILVGPDGLAYFAVTTTSQYFPVSGFGFSPYQPAPAGAQEIAIGAIDPRKSGDASLVYSTFLGGSGNDEVRGLAFDNDGRLLVTGYTLSTDFPVTVDAMQHENRGNADAFVMVVNPSKPPEEFLVYSTYLGGAHGDVGYDVKADSAGNIYVTGYTLSSDFPVLNAPQPEWGFGTNIFLTRLRPGVSGGDALGYSTFFGATGTYLATALAVGADGTAYVAGYGNTGLPATDGATQRAFAGGASDGFVLIVAQ